MKKTLACLVVVTLLLASFGAEAAKKKKKKTEEIPTSDKIAEQMGDLKWGMDKDDVFKLKKKEIEASYKPQFMKIAGAIEEDRLRTRMLDDLRKLKSSYVEFDGQNTGWEVSMIGREFTHNNAEGLMMAKMEKYDEYLFFIRGKLWKRFRAFKRDEFKGLTFLEFIDRLENLFGKGKRVEKPNEYGEPVLAQVEWQDGETLLRAVDNSGFYGVFCMVFINKDTLSRIDQLRTNQDDRKRHDDMDTSLIDSITSGTAKDEHGNIIDDLTGKNHGDSKIDLSHSVTGKNVKDKEEDKGKDKDQKKDFLDDDNDDKKTDDLDSIL